MKTVRILIFGLLAMATASRAQITNGGWYYMPQRDDLSAFSEPDNSTETPQSGSPPAAGTPILPLISQPTQYIAEAITPQIQTLANDLQDNPVAIYNYVHDHIKYVPYWGSKKGAQLTLLEKSGNDFDQSALLAALLQAAGYNPTYQFGWMQVPYDAKDGTHNDLHHWLQLNFANTNWNYTSNYLFNLFYNVRGYPTIDYLSRYTPFTDTNTFMFQRVWVTLTINSTNYFLDPAFKVSKQITNAFNLASAMQFSSNSVMSTAGGTETGGYSISGLNEANIRDTLTGYTTNLLNYIQSNSPNASMQQVLGGWQIVASTNTSLPTNLAFAIQSYPLYPAMNVTNWSVMPTNFMATLSVSFAHTNYQCYVPQLEGQRLSLTYDTNANAQLWLNDTLMAQGNAGSETTNEVVLYFNQQFGNWNFTNNTLIPDAFGDMNVTNSYQSTNASYALAYAFEPDWGWLQARENQLDEYLSEGLTNTSRQVVCETLNIMGLNWMLQTEGADSLIGQQLGILPQYHLRLGRMAQEYGHGYYVDIYMQLDGSIPNTGWDAANQYKESQDFNLKGYFQSALESGLIEQLQNSNLAGASTIKMLEIANTNGQPVFLVNSNNWFPGTSQDLLSTELNYYDFYSLVNITILVDEGYNILMPEYGSNYVAGTGTWRGYGYVGQQNYGEAVAAFTISGNYNGGYDSNPNATVNAGYTQTSGDSQSQYYNSVPILTPDPTGADPIDMADGTFQVENIDLSLGQSEPHGMTLTRYYNGTRRNSNAAGIGYGWVHNYYLNADNVPAPQAGLGGTTPAQAASMMAATCAAIGIYNGGQPDPKNWMVTALIAKWGIDQLTRNGVSVSLGKDMVQFVRQPNGVFTPPANCTMTLIQTNGAYWLQMRHGNTFKFNATGYGTNIVDQYGQSVNITYTSSNYVNTVTDWKGRILTFSYGTSGGFTSKTFLLSVSDGSRTNNYYYSPIFSSQGDLVDSVDPDDNFTAYLYDTNHEITASWLQIYGSLYSQEVVSNVYDGLGHVAQQYTEGDPNKMWQIFWAGWQTIAEDPAGGQQSYFYDDQGRLIGAEDALGNLTQTTYDGQNHIIQTVSPLGETNRFVYDGNNNLTNSTDPLGYSMQYLYDGNNNLIKQIDQRGNIDTFGYNSEFSLTGQTNGAGDWVNYSYTTSGNLAGTLASKTDSGGMTSYGYDSTYGQLTSIVYPSSLGSESFSNSWMGVVTNHTDGRGFAISYRYNNRLELTNTVAPTNLTISVLYDPANNVISRTDARGNAATYTYSASRKLLASTLPSVTAGTPVLTNIYDNRDWLVGSIDPLQNSTLFTNDATGKTVSQTDPLLRTTMFGYDGDGRKVATTNAAGEVTLQFWNAKGQLEDLIDGAGHSVLRAYDAAGNQIILTNRNGNVWQFHFDGANRLTNTISPLGYSTTMAFNHQGLPAFLEDPKGQTTTNSYDGKNRLTNRTDNVATTLYKYDASDSCTNVLENGLTNAWTYDAYNRVSSYKDVYGNLIQYRYDLNGNMTNLIYPGGRNIYYAYDSNNHLTNVLDWSGRKTSLTYDLDGQMTSITRPNGTKRTISYDVAGQITNILEANSLGFPLALFEFNWNSNSTAKWEFDAPLPHTNAPPTRTMTYDVDNRLAKVDGNSVTMDADGNLVSGPLTNDTFATYTYDARNRMLNAGGVTNVYDAMNNRIGQTYGTNTTVFIVNPNSKLPEVLMRIKNGVTNYYVYAGGAGLIYQITEAASGTNTLTYHFDYRGSTVALSDNNGNVTDRMEYSLYATMTYRVGTNDTPFLFNGRYGVQSDPNGLLYMRARYYNPFLCRFINPDPSGFSGGLNFYAYANGNPVSFLDPFGLSFWSVTGHFAEGVVIGAAVAVVVVIAAPEIAAGGAAALVWASAGEISAATATTYASATVTVGLATTATYGASQVAGDAVGSAEGGNWDQVAFDAGTLTGGLVVGGGGGGRALAENITGSPSSIKPSWNPFGDMSASYDSDYPNGSLLNWLATAPTPQSGAGVLTLTAGSAASSTLGNWINESTTTVSVNPNPISAPTESGPIQSSSTGK